MVFSILLWSNEVYRTKNDDDNSVRVLWIAMGVVAAVGLVLPIFAVVPIG